MHYNAMYNANYNNLIMKKTNNGNCCTIMEIVAQ